MLSVTVVTECAMGDRGSDSQRRCSQPAPPYHYNISHESLVTLEEIEFIGDSEVRVEAGIMPQQDPSTDSGDSMSSGSSAALPCYDQVLTFKQHEHLRSDSELVSFAFLESGPSTVHFAHCSRRLSNQDPRAGTLGLTVNGSVLRQASLPVISVVRATRPTSTASPIPEPAIKPPSAFAIAFLGRKRALERARQRAERRAARLEEIHEAWGRLGINTRELLTRGGKSALPPHFKNPPLCTWEEMMAQV